MSSASIMAPHPRIRNLRTRDIVVMIFVVALNISDLRWQLAGVPDLEQLRAELRRREFDLAAPTRSGERPS